MAKPTLLAPPQRRALDQLKAIPELTRFYLAGGTAVGFYLQHRTSIDLDFFSLDPEEDLEGIRQVLAKRCKDFEVQSSTPAALRAKLSGAAVDFVAYPYPPLHRPRAFLSGLAVADLLDLSVMKLAAVASRGLRRDFWDLWAICGAGIPLELTLRAYRRRYGTSQSDLYHVIRSLTWFAEAEQVSAYPRGLSESRWEQIKRFFEATAPDLLKTPLR